MRSLSFYHPWLRDGGVLAEDFVVGVKGEGGGEGSDVGDERGILQ